MGKNGTDSDYAYINYTYINYTLIFISNVQISASVESKLIVDLMFKYQLQWKVN